MEYLLGIDIGTSGVKAVLTDRLGNDCARGSASYETRQPRPGYVEQDPSLWWEAAVDCVRACLGQSGVDPGAVAGVCASGMVPNLCPLDGEGEPVGEAILYRDNRGVEQAARLEERLGLPFGSQDVAPKLLWIKEHEPARYARIRHVLNSHSYLAYRLTGRINGDRDIAAIFGNAYDTDLGQWLPERVRSMGLDPEMLPPLYGRTETVGRVTARAARETGLREGTPVVAGTGDSFTILVGTGTARAQEGLIYLGTAATFLWLKQDLDRVVDDPFARGDVRFLANVLMGGEIVRWFREKLQVAGTPDFECLERMAAEVPPGAEGLVALPHFLGERTPVSNPLSKGALVGLTNAHGGEQVYRALLEGVAYALRASYEKDRVPLTQLTVAGGGANSHTFLTIIASVLDRELKYYPKGDNARGTAYLAGVALGLLPGYASARETWLTEQRTVSPDPTAVRAYQKGYETYLTVNRALVPLFSTL